MDCLRYAARDLEGDERMLVPESGRPPLIAQDQENVSQPSLNVSCLGGKQVGEGILCLVYHLKYFIYQ